MEKNYDPTKPMKSIEEKCQWHYDMAIANGATEYRALEAVRDYLAGQRRDQMEGKNK